MSQTIRSEVEYEIASDGIFVTPDQSIAVHREVGDSKFDYVLVGSDPDSGEDDVIAFGFQEGELPIELPD